MTVSTPTRNPLDLLERITAPLGRIIAIPFGLLVTVLNRIYLALNAHPVAYQRASRGLAGGILASFGVFIAVTIVGNIGLLQGLKMLGGKVWTVDEVLAMIVLAALVGFIVGFGLFKMRPTLLRGILAGVTAFAFTTCVVMVVRYFFGYEPWATGTVFMFAGFPTAFGAIWGMGGFAKQNMTIEANLEAREHPPTQLANIGAFDGVRFNYRVVRFIGDRIWPVIKPLIGPAVIVAVLVGSVVAVLLVIGSIFPARRIQTDVNEAAATTIAGTVDFLGLQLPKFLVFLIVAAIILGAVATTGLLFALLFNSLGNGVRSAKAAAAKPLDLTEKSGRNGIFAKLFRWTMRFVKFNIDFIADIVNGIAGAFGSRSAR